MSISGNNDGSASGGSDNSGSSSRRKRNYRHFGPSGSAGDAPASGAPSAGQRSGPVEQKREDRKVHRDNGTSPPEQPVKTSQNQPKPAAASGTRSASRSGKNRRSHSSQNRQPGQAPGQDVSAVTASQPVEQPDKKQAEPAAQQTRRQNKPVRERSNRPEQSDRNSRTLPSKDRSARWENKIKTEENYEDVRQDIDRIEKEIWLEIAGLHTIKLDY